jgi:hypothetical protein
VSPFAGGVARQGDPSEASHLTLGVAGGFLEGFADRAVDAEVVGVAEQTQGQRRGHADLGLH